MESTILRTQESKARVRDRDELKDIWTGHPGQEARISLTYYITLTSGRKAKEMQFDEPKFEGRLALLDCCKFGFVCLTWRPSPLLFLHFKVIWSKNTPHFEICKRGNNVFLLFYFVLLVFGSRLQKVGRLYCTSKSALKNTRTQPHPVDIPLRDQRERILKLL